MKKLIFTLQLCIMLLWNANATILNVPSQYATIQAAILASSDGDTVLVSPGVYYENINFRGRKIVLTSLFYLNNDTTYILNTIINGGLPLYADTATCIILNHNEDSTTIIQGFSIVGGAGTKWVDIHGAGTFREGGGIITEFSSPVIRYNFIHNNFVNNKQGVNSTGGGAIRCGDGSPVIANNVICSNQAYGYGGGIVSNFCNITIRNNLIANNTGGHVYGGGGIWLNGTNLNTKAEIINNTIVNNHALGTGQYGGKGGGIFNFSIQANVKNNIVWGNTQNTGGVFAAFAGGAYDVTYSNVQTVVTGVGNLSVDPLFADSDFYLLTVFSPCIDAGDSASIYNDNEVTPGVAAFPSMGTAQNDMGCYGGPYAKLLPSCPNSSYGFGDIDDYISFNLFPVPVDRYLHIDIDNPQHEAILAEVYNACGQKVAIKILTDNHSILNMETHEAGLYAMNLFCRGKQYGPKKFMVFHP